MREPGQRRPVKKKRRRQELDPKAALAWKLAIGAGVVLLLVVAGILTVLFLLPVGEAESDKGITLIGKWKGTADIGPGIGEVAKNKLPPVIEGIAQAALQKLANESMAVNINFKKNGKVFFSGNTQRIGVPADSDGAWDILQQDDDILTVRMGPAGGSFEARLAFRDKHTFVLTRPDRKDQAPVVFTRLVDEG
jgi:hypothetical protein